MCGRPGRCRNDIQLNSTCPLTILEIQIKCLLSLSLYISNCLEQYISIGNVQITYFTPENKYPFSQTPYPHPPPADPNPGHITTPNENPLVDEHPRTINIFNNKNNQMVCRRTQQKNLCLSSNPPLGVHIRKSATRRRYVALIILLRYLFLFPMFCCCFQFLNLSIFSLFSSIVLLPPSIVFYSFY